MNTRRHLLGRLATLTPMAWLSGTRTAAAAGDARALMERVDRQSRPAFESAQLRMELHGEGPMLSRDLDLYVAASGDKRTTVLKFTAPANVQAVGLMVVEEGGVTSAIWHYMPASRNLRRISAEHRQNRFMGTELVFEDFEGLKLDRYRFELLRQESCGALGSCSVVEATPSDVAERDTSGYSRKRFWVSLEREVIVRTDLFDRSDQLIKQFEAEDFRAHGRFWRPRRQTMRHLASGRKTVLEERTRQVDQPFDRHFVSPQYLRSE